MRGVNGGDSRALNDTLQTINAAATAIASAENRVPQATARKRRWGNCWSIYWCFGFKKHRKRIGHASLVPEPTASQSNASAAVNSTQAPAIVLPFVAPPSSPASFLQSEPQSATQSPAGLISLNSLSANMYSPGGPSSIFAIGPYAHETQLVSPPVFSTFTTEPSTAPFTPPPESVHLTTPSSPEVPFAQLLDPNLRYGEHGQKFPFLHYEFQSYHLHPGSPVGNLISPSSGISGSGTSSPFPDGEFAAAGPQFPDFHTADPPKLLNLGKLSIREWGSRQGSGTLTPDAGRSTPSPRNGFFQNCQISGVLLRPQSENGLQKDQTADHRVSFELSTEEVVRCVEKKPTTLLEAVSESLQNGTTAEKEESSGKVENVHHSPIGETANDTPDKAPVDVEEASRHQKQPSITLGSTKEFNFDSTDGDSHEPNIASDWWANEKVVGKESGTIKNWTPSLLYSQVRKQRIKSVMSATCAQSQLSYFSSINRKLHLQRRFILSPVFRSSKSWVCMCLGDRGADNTSSEIKTTVSYTADESKPYVEETKKSYPTIEEEHSSGDIGKNESVPEGGVTLPKKAAKIHDFCFGIPYGGLVLGGGLLGLIFSRNPENLRTILIGGALLALSTFSLKIWRQGKSSLPFILGQTVLSAVLLRQNFEAYSLTKKLFPTGFYAAISAAMLCFYSYVVASGGNPPPKKLKSSSSTASPA